jgi:Fic family protein
LEGTFAPIEDVLTASADEPQDDAMSEVLRYVSMASHAFASIMSGRRLTMNLICEMHGELLRDSALESGAGRLRDTQVMIGSHVPGTPLQVVLDNSRFVPCPPGDQLQAGMDQLVAWMDSNLGQHVDPVIATAMLHYQFECLHPFVDGNGRVGRLLVVLYLLQCGWITEPTLFVSPWFEARRDRYFELLLRVSTHNDWDSYIRFFAQGIEESAHSTSALMQTLTTIQGELKDQLVAAGIRAESAQRLIDYAISNPTFTVAQAAKGTSISYPRANKVIAQLVDLEILNIVRENTYRRRFYTPKVHQALINSEHASS